MLRSILRAPDWSKTPSTAKTFTTSANIEYYHWWYQKEFGLPNSFAGEQMELTLHGVNTIAEVFVNDTLVGKCDDMMIEHRFRVEKALRPGDFNTIAFTFSPQ